VVSALAAPARAQGILAAHAPISGFDADVQTRPAPQNPPRTPAPAPRPAAPKKPGRPWGLHIYFLEDFNILAAHASFDAVVGTSKLQAPGAGVDVLKLWKDAFVRVAFSRMSHDGERVSISGADVVSLGIPLKVSMTPIEISGGWRFEPKSKPAAPTPPRPGQPTPPRTGQPAPLTPTPARPGATPPPQAPPARPGQPTTPPTPARPGAPTTPAVKVKKHPLVPYVGGGLLMLKYTETSDFAESSDNSAETFKGAVVFGGLDVPLTKRLFVGGEVQYRSLRNALGSGGVSGHYGEKNLGGATVRFLVGFKK
jgi:hypothetical protein